MHPKASQLTAKLRLIGLKRLDALVVAVELASLIDIVTNRTSSGSLRHCLLLKSFLPHNFLICICIFKFRM